MGEESRPTVWVQVNAPTRCTGSQFNINITLYTFEKTLFAMQRIGYAPAHQVNPLPTVSCPCHLSLVDNLASVSVPPQAQTKHFTVLLHLSVIVWISIAEAL